METVSKTDKQIQEAIALLEKLKTTMPRHSIFGDDNHERIDCQIDVLNGKGFMWNNSDYASLVMDVVDWKKGENESWLQDLRDDIENFKS